MTKVKKLKVVLVADSMVNDEVLTTLLKANGQVEEVAIQTIHEVTHALDEIRKTSVKPHFVVISEPVQNKNKFAMEVPSRIKEIKNINPAIEVIVLATPLRLRSGTASKEEAAIETFRAGAYDVISQDQYASKNVANSIHRFLNNLEEVDIKKQKAQATM